MRFSNSTRSPRWGFRFEHAVSLKQHAKDLLRLFVHCPTRIRVGLLRGRYFVVDPRERSLRLFGLDETEIASAVRGFTADSEIAVDVGANDGWYSVFFASCKNIRRVIALEPAPSAWPLLEKNLEANGAHCAAKVELIRRFAGCVDSEQSRKLDSVLQAEHRKLIVKIDVEGGEADVLKGAARILQSRQARLIIETHSREAENECLSLLHGFGYHVSIVNQGWYRSVVPEYRPLAHNRWLVAQPGGQ